LHVPEHTQDKDLEATADVAPKKLAGGKKNRVAPGSGEPDDDSELGLEELLLQDEAARGDGVAAKKIKEKPAAGKGGHLKRQHFTCQLETYYQCALSRIWTAQSLWSFWSLFLTDRGEFC
jgi:hypothetical protein